MVMNEPDVLRGLRASARAHGISHNTLNELLRRGDVAYVRLNPGGERRIPDSAVREWIQRNLVRAGSER